MRTFVAIFPPPEVARAALEAARGTRLARKGLDDQHRIRWTPPGSVHLTLKFLGEVAEQSSMQVGAALNRVCAGHVPFVVRPSGRLGAFPSERRASVVWAGFEDQGAERLRALAASVEGTLAPLGFEPEDRPYEPHLTLGRVRGRPAMLEPPPTLGDLPGFQVRNVELVRSTLGAGGSAYEVVGTFTLGNASGDA